MSVVVEKSKSKKSTVKVCMPGSMDNTKSPGSDIRDKYPYLGELWDTYCFTIQIKYWVDSNNQDCSNIALDNSATQTWVVIEQKGTQYKTRITGVKNRPLEKTFESSKFLLEYLMENPMRFESQDSWQKGKKERKIRELEIKEEDIQTQIKYLTEDLKKIQGQLNEISME